jgi:hypothetical protein
LHEATDVADSVMKPRLIFELAHVTNYHNVVVIIDLLQFVLRCSIFRFCGSCQSGALFDVCYISSTWRKCCSAVNVDPDALHRRSLLCTPSTLLSHTCFFCVSCRDGWWRVLPVSPVSGFRIISECLPPFFEQRMSPTFNIAGRDNNCTKSVTRSPELKCRLCLLSSHSLIFPCHRDAIVSDVSSSSLSDFW